MKVIFLSSFSKDLKKITVQQVRNEIVSVTEAVENASNLKEIKGVKKLVGFKNAYRIRIGDYRMGIFFEENAVEFARVIHRKIIYKKFPQ